MSSTTLALAALLFFLTMNGSLTTSQMFIVLAILASTNLFMCGCQNTTNNTTTL